MSVTAPVSRTENPTRVAIGGACGYWGDAAHATRQLLTYEPLNYLVYDYLAEVTLSIMARARQSDAALGFARDFVTAALAPNLKQIADRGVKVVSNAGGMNPLACGAAVCAAVDELALDLKVAVITGDDVVDQMALLQEQHELYSGAPFPDVERVVSANAYLGAQPIAQALRAGADIVIAGRCVDSALTLGVCLAEFEWGMHELDRLAQASLAGHLIECGVQATGGNFTDWRDIDGTMVDIGYPIAIIDCDARIDLTKPPGTGGKVSVGTVSEQLVYEIEDPQRYLLPDVVCDFSRVTLEQTDAHTVRVVGALGGSPPTDYKVSVTYTDGHKTSMSLGFYGFEAVAKAEAFAAAALSRTEANLRERGLNGLSESNIEIVGADSQFGGDGRVPSATDSNGGAETTRLTATDNAMLASPLRRGVSVSRHDRREVQLNLAVKHNEMAGAAIFVQAVTGLGLATPPGLAIFQTGRPKPSPVVRLFSCTLARDAIDAQVVIDSTAYPVDHAARDASDVSTTIERPAEPQAIGEVAVSVPLIQLAWGRSGDKGDRANIGIIARDRAYLPWIWQGLEPARVEHVFAPFTPSRVDRFLLPGIHAVNLVLHDVLGGGGMASLRGDAQGKAYAQVLLHLPIAVPKDLAESL
ncbi:MAG: acyclic terpene utilization AtuA family protein [Pseudomonadota bacterium]